MNHNDDLQNSMKLWFGIFLRGNPISWIGLVILAVSTNGLMGIPALLIVLPLASAVLGVIFGTIAWLGRDRN